MEALKARLCICTSERADEALKLCIKLPAAPKQPQESELQVKQSKSYFPTPCLFSLFGRRTLSVHSGYRGHLAAGSNPAAGWDASVCGVHVLPVPAWVLRDGSSQAVTLHTHLCSLRGTLKHRSQAVTGWWRIKFFLLTVFLQHYSSCNCNHVWA